MASRSSSEFFSRMIVFCAGIMVFLVPYLAAEPQKAPLSANSKLFNIWRQTSAPTYLEVYFFNVTNVADILARKEGKIQVKEIGPYVFKETSKKTNLTWNANNTLTYYNQKWWHFVPEKSVGPLSDQIVNVNPAIQRNGSIEYDGPLTINTGATDLSQLGNVESWRFSNRTAFRDECGEVKGSTGELWAPEYGQDEMAVFSPYVGTYLTLNKDRNVNIHGVEGVQYTANDLTFDNGQKNTRKACFCTEDDTSKCISGALNATNYHYNGPLFVSLPHFLHADPYYPSKIEGLNATEDMNYRLVVDKKTGLPLSITAQLQYNLLIRDVTGKQSIPSKLDNILPDADTLVPMFWFREKTETTPEYAKLLQSVAQSHDVPDNKMAEMTKV